jgi:hypothetical protein
MPPQDRQRLAGVVHHSIVPGTVAFVVVTLNVVAVILDPVIQKIAIKVLPS